MERRELNDESRQEIKNLYDNVYSRITKGIQISEEEVVISEFSAIAAAMAGIDKLGHPKSLPQFGRAMKKQGFTLCFEYGQEVPDHLIDQVLRKIA